MPSFRTAVPALLTLVAQVLAGVQFTNSDISVIAGEPITLTWSGDQEGKVTIRLLTGSSDNLQEVDTITTSGEDGSFTWTPPEDLASGTYAFEISDESDDEVNYSSVFAYQADGSSTSTASASETTDTSNATTLTSATFSATTLTAGNGTITTSSPSKTSSSDDDEATTTKSDSSGTSPANLNGDDQSGASSKLAGVYGTASFLAIVGAFAVAL